MKQPIEPSKEDCCNSGCNPCIFDVYEKQLNLYRKFLETGQTTEDVNELENAVSQLEYSSFALVEVVKICKAHIQLFFRRLVKDNKKVWWKPGDHFLLKYSDKDTSCTRAYTPIKCRNQTKQCDFSIIVKVYENGLVTNYLNQLNVGDETLWRGPYGSYDITSNSFRRIVMIAQGTGIAPFISIIERILENEDNMTRIILYYCTKDEDSIILREELYSYKEYWNFSYKIFLSQSTHSMKCKYQEPILHHKLELEDLNLLKPFASSDQFLLCGSQEFMKNIRESIRSEQNELENIYLF